VDSWGRRAQRSLVVHHWSPVVHRPVHTPWGQKFRL